jgi:hypothetical protein
MSLIVKWIVILFKIVLKKTCEILQSEFENAINEYRKELAEEVAKKVVSKLLKEKSKVLNKSRVTKRISSKKL